MTNTQTLSPMISKLEVWRIAKAYLKEKEREYVELSKADTVELEVSKKVLFGDHAGEIVDQYTIEYLVPWGLEEKEMYIHVDAHSGEVLFTTGPRTWVEEWENFDEEEFNY